MKQLVSRKVDLPVIYLVNNQEEWEKLPLGIPFIYGEESLYDKIVQYLEWTMLLRSAEATGFPFKWEDELKKLGFRDVRFDNDISLYFSGETHSRTVPTKATKPCSESEFRFDVDNYIKDGFLVSYGILSLLKIIPSWLKDLEASIKVNIINAVSFNPTAFSKKMGGFYGAPEMATSKRNLGILDFSGSIPTSVVVTTAALAKTLSKTFFCDILITGSGSKLFKYEELDGIDLMKEAQTIGRNNDQVDFLKIVSEERDYNAVFSFGDDDYPGYTWCDKSRHIKEDEGKELCKFTVEKVISLHTKQNGSETGYTRWFSPKEGVQHVSNWLHTLKR